MTSSDDPPRRRGRPRDSTIDDALLRAALAEFTAHGVHMLRMEAIATRAGVSKVSLYRRWKSRRDVVADVFRSLADARPLADHGSLRADLAVLLDESIGSADARTNAIVVMRTMGEISDDADLLELYRRHLLSPRLDRLRAMVDRARDRGELRPDVDTDTAVALIAGPIFAYHLALLTDTARPDTLRTTTADAILNGIAAKATP